MFNWGGYLNAGIVGGEVVGVLAFRTFIVYNILLAIFDCSCLGRFHTRVGKGINEVTRMTTKTVSFMVLNGAVFLLGANASSSNRLEPVFEITKKTQIFFNIAFQTSFLAGAKDVRNCDSKEQNLERLFVH